MQKVNFYYLDRNPGLKNRNQLKRFIQQLFSREGKQLGGLSYIFCSDKHLLGINKDFLNHDYYTDVITFDLSDRADCIQAEIYISIDRIRDNAQSIKVTFKEELHRVMLHGALHLCGYRDKKPEEVKIMRSKEDKYLKLYFN